MTSESVSGAAAVDVSVVAPMYNEEANVASTVAEITGTMDSLGVEWEFVMVDDGSTDATLQHAQEAASSNPRIRVVSYTPNAGRGRALRTGFRTARGEFVLSTDFDLSYSPDHLVRMYKRLKDNPDLDVVLGSAYMPGGASEGVPWRRLAISKLGNHFIRLAMGGRFHTFTCVLRGYRRRALDDLELQSDGKEIHLEILSKLLALGCNVEEMPATLRWRKKGSSKFRFGRTSLSHLAFGLFERPMMIFGALGALLILAGSCLGVYLVVVQRTGKLNPERPLMTVMVVFLLAGMQILSFGYLALQILELRKQLFVAQRGIRRLRSRDS